MTLDYLEIARDLIRTESITGNEEPVARYLEGILRGLGFEVRSQEVEPGRRNLLAGPERPALLFSTHMDTVPPYVPFREDGEWLYGRGACDTKGIIACLLEAGRRLREEGFSDFGYLFLVGEEVDNAGARAANETVRAGAIVVGEPTERRLAVGHKGALGARLRARGVACHSAYPERGDSAIHRLIPVLARILDTDFGNDRELGPATVNIGTVAGGVAQNVLAPEAEARILVRVVDSTAAAEERLRAAVYGAPEATDPRLELDVTLRMEPVRLNRLEGFPECVVAYGTDLPFLRDVGRPYLFGPGSILDAHTEGEKISKREMALAVEDYVAIGKRLLRNK